MRPLGVEIAALLAARGVDTVFGIPGVHNIELYRGIEQAGLRHVLARNEIGAGFMADGYARATGRPGVCFVITGPGFTNVMTPVGQAYSDHVPMLVIASCLDETAARSGQLHQMRDQEEAGRTVAEWSETARTPEAALALVDRALPPHVRAYDRPRVVHVPISVLGGPAPSHAAVPKSRQETRLPADPTVVELAASELRAAKKPLLILGGGARDLRTTALPGPRMPVDALLDLAPVAVFTTYAGRGIVPSTYPLLFGSSLARPGSADIAGQADLVIAIGTELSEVDLWRDELGHDCPMLRVDASRTSLARRVGATLDIHADAHSFVSALCDALGPDPLAFDWTEESVAKARDRWRQEVDSERPGIVPICDALRDALPEDTMVFSDMTQFAYVAKEVWDMPAPGRWHHPYGFGTLGYALPAAIGGALGHGGPTLAIAGDSGLQYTLQELGTAAELGLSLPILLWDNDALGEIRDNMVAAQIAPNAVTQVNPDWRALAEAYRIGYAEPSSPGELADTVTAAFSAGRPTLVRATPGISSSS